MDPNHRSRIAFVKVCSGKFERNVNYKHVRFNRMMKFSSPTAFMAQKKEILDEAYAGDIVGLPDTGNFKIGDNEAVPAYPNATYHVSLKQWNNYRKPSLFEKGSFFADNIEPVYDAGQLKFVLEDIQLDENIRLELYDGHTPGQIAVLFENEDGKYAFPGDVVPTSLNLQLSWLCAYDNSMVVAMEEKKRFMDKAKADNRTLIFYHDAYTTTGKF